MSDFDIYSKDVIQSQNPVSIIKKKDPQIGKNKFVKYIPDIFLKYFEKVVGESYIYVSKRKESKKVKIQIKKQILRKYKHCYEVLEAAFEILGGMKGKSRWNLHQVAISNILHDIGRFVKPNNSRNDKLDHGDSGYIQLRNSLRSSRQLRKSLNRLGCNTKSILNVISNHNKYSYFGDDKYVHLCRDADKIALLRNDRLQVGFILDSSQYRGFLLSGEAKKDFLKNGMIKGKNTKTKADAILRTLSFFGQFHFDQTKKIVEKEKLFQKWEDIFKNYIQEVDDVLSRKIKKLDIE